MKKFQTFDAKQSEDDGKGMHVVSKFGTFRGSVGLGSQWGPLTVATGSSLAGGQARGATPGWAWEGILGFFCCFVSSGGCSASFWNTFCGVSGFALV